MLGAEQARSPAPPEGLTLATVRPAAPDWIAQRNESRVSAISSFGMTCRRPPPGSLVR